MSKLESLEELFGGRHFDREIIILCVRWYVRYKLSLETSGECTYFRPSANVAAWYDSFRDEKER